MEIRRDLTNLAIRKDLTLPKSQLKKGFLFVFNKGYTGNEYTFINRLWLSAILPGLATDPRFGRGFDFKGGTKKYPATYFARYLRIRKDLTATPQHFRVSVPVFSSAFFTAANLSEFVSGTFFPSAKGKKGRKGEDEAQTVEPQNVVQQEGDSAGAPQETTDVSAPSIPVPHFEIPDDVAQILHTNDQLVHKAFIPREVVLRSATWLDTKGREELGQSFLGVRVEAKGDMTIVFLEFSISQAEAQQLTSTPWIAIRNIDLYPLVFNWVLTYWGQRGRPLISSFPISSIAKTLPPSHNQPENVRVDQYGLAISDDGAPVAIPKEVNNAERYEDLYSQAGTKDDNSYCYSSLSDPQGHLTALPANIPVLVDWQNLKFAYSNTNGVLQVMDLTRYIPCNASHAFELLNARVGDALLKKLASLASVSSTSTRLGDYFKQEDLDDANKTAEEGKAITMEQFRIDPSMDIMLYFQRAATMYVGMTGQMRDEIQVYDLTNGGWPLFRPLYRFVKALHDNVEGNLDAIYAKYSVAYTISVMGWVKLIAKYGENYGVTRAEAMTVRGPAMNQHVDPNWEMPSVPLLSDKIGLLPHQKKVRNLLKDSPDFAILPVQAGGGKTPLALIDVLLEIKANRSQPYLIMCPSHLVAQYVKEIVFFTSGKLNVIPITSYASRMNGFERLGAIFKAAPRNTVVVVDYDALKFRAVNTVYGTAPTAVFPLIEFLRQFRFGYVLCDESHYLKNDSARTRASLALIADIPKKRLASGTMAHDSPADLAMQVALLDPTLFGSKDQFNETYGAEFSGDKVAQWKPNAAQSIMGKIRSRVVVAGAMRREWAALLPQPQEKFLRVDMSDAQLAVYNSILEATMEKIKEAAKTNKALASFVAGDANAESEADDEDSSDALESMLRPYIARLEQFMTAPARDPLGDKLLSGDDRISPKVRMIAQRIREHIDAGTEGKVLIFTNYTESAEEIFNQMPDDLKAMGILYVAADKVEAGSTFENSAKKKWMVGVENSMNTGLNLQFVSRLIRVETVWNPGTLEQGNSRINRPELKKADRRDFIFYDWIVANQSIDVTKISRLISKIVAIAKFENADDGAYQGLPDVPVIKMSLENIQGYNNWDSALFEYFKAYKDFKQVQADDFAEYRKKHGDLVLAPIELAPTPEDAALLKRVPYVPGLELYGTDDLGLVRLDEYLRLDAAESDEEGGDDSEDESENGDDSENGAADPNDAKKRARELLVGKMAHTEYGDGTIIGIALSSRRVAVRLSSGGYVVRTRLANTFLVTRTETSTKDIRNQLLKSVGAMPIATPVDVPALSFKQAKFTKRELLEQQRREQEQQKLVKKVKKAPPKVLAMEIEVAISNGFLGLTSFNQDEELCRALEAVGFRPTQPFVYAEVKNANALTKQFNIWKEEGFTLDKKLAGDLSESFRNLHQLLKSGAVKTHRVSYKFSVASKLRNFFRLELKPTSDPTVIKPFPMIEEGLAYIMMPFRGQSGTAKAIQHRAPGIRWKKSEPSMVYFCPSAAKADEVLGIIESTGIQISNIKELKKELSKLRKIPVRNDNDLSEDE